MSNNEHKVNIVAEAYRIRAVAFETPAEAAQAEQAVAGLEAADTNTGGSNGDEEKQPRKNDGSLDFGRRRVGDSATERFSLRNR